MSIDMTTKKTSISIEEKLWQEFQIYALKVTGSNRRASEKVEDALKEYMSNHPVEA